ncbi:hypothetical protein MLD38_010652 [Melastoma candidum]|uniref:Uncharacterized protein n=1 Tax=Melastoma candidum TaxID=119954 RepID=A0ACB9R0K2_9MYRT|nr:hypothetical protein MLD38_010652 [Melastoma candidum]
MGKRGPCYHCGVTSTPLWRNGPPDKPVLCNACGSRWRTKGSLVNYTPLHCRVESVIYGEHGPFHVNSAYSDKGKGVKHHNRKQNEDEKVFRRVGSVAVYQEVMDEEVISNRSSSDWAVSEFDAWFGSVITSNLTGPAESVVQESPEPSRKRMCTDRVKHSSIKNFAKYLHTILQEQQSSCFSGATSDEDLLLERQMPMGSAEFGHGSALIQHRNESTLEDYEKGGSNLRRNPIGGKRTRDIKNHGVSGLAASLLRPSCVLLLLSNSKMAKRTKKVGIVGKYGTRYGASLRKQIKKMEVTQHSKYFCEFCGKFAVKRKAVGIWGCKDCGKVKAGGAYTLNTASAVTVRSTIRRLREQTES